MAELPEFQPFEKIARLRRDCVITEKIDGTNAQVHVTEEGRVLAGSRTRYITTADDNHGWARWVAEHEAELRDGLGEGRHYGEWWGAGIQRRYGQQTKRFSLFNTSRWGAERPACCDVVPVLYAGPFSSQTVEDVLDDLARGGSVAAPGFDKPEGVVIYLPAARALFKVTLVGDEVPKGQANG